MIYELANYFVWQPLRGYAVAGCFATLLGFSFIVNRQFKKILHLPAALACVAWFLFGLNEFIAKVNGWDIRIDLLLFWPGILLLSGVCTIVWLAGIAKIMIERRKTTANRTVDPGGSTSG